MNNGTIIVILVAFLLRIKVTISIFEGHFLWIVYIFCHFSYRVCFLIFSEALAVLVRIFFSDLISSIFPSSKTYPSKLLFLDWPLLLMRKFKVYNFANMLSRIVFSNYSVTGFYFVIFKSQLLNTNVFYFYIT